jgi:hypothetical protein
MEASLYNAIVPVGNDGHGSDHGDASEDSTNTMAPINDLAIITQSEVIDGWMLEEFFKFMDGNKGLNKQYEVYMAEFHSFLVDLLCQNFRRDGVEVWVERQMGFLMRMREKFLRLEIDFPLDNSVAVTQDPAMAVDSLPISDADFLAEVLHALADGTNVFDMPDTAPLKHWHNDMKPESLEKIAKQFLVCTILRLLGVITD